MSIEHEVMEVIRAEAVKNLQPVREKIKLLVAEYVKTKAFQKAVHDAVIEEIDEVIFGDDVLACLTKREVTALKKKAVRSILR